MAPKVAVSEDSSLNENFVRGADIQSDTTQYFFFIQDLGINTKLLLKKKNLVHVRQEELQITVRVKFTLERMRSLGLLEWQSCESLTKDTCHCHIL